MTVHSDLGALSIEKLGPPDLPETFAFLDADPVLNVYLIALALRDGLATPRDEFWGARREGRLTALLFLGAQSGSVLPIGTDADALARLGEVARTRAEFLPRRIQVIGPRDAVGPLLEHFPGGPIAARLARDQIYLSLTRAALPRFERVPELRAARREDYATIYESGALLRAEELLEDPRDLDPIAYARRAEEDCRDGHTFLWRDAQGLAFRAGVSALTPDAAQVSGVYTPPERRGRGLATRGLAELCDRLLERSRHVCLFVNDFNAPALAVYHRLGFRDHAAWRSSFFDLPR